MKTKLIVESKRVEELLSEASSELESLKDEMREWEERMGDSDGLSATAKYEAVSECADRLEEVCESIEESKSELLEGESGRPAIPGFVQKYKEWEPGPMRPGGGNLWEVEKERTIPAKPEIPAVPPAL